MKPSTSTTSLTALDEKGCIICAETEGEAGELIASTSLVQCKCLFRVHPSCWDAKVLQTDRKLCPSCSKTVSHPSSFYASLSVKRGYGTNQGMTKTHWYILYGIIVLAVVIAIVIAGVQYRWTMKLS
jgi:hypothetical protein